jgi:hypothetical protein
VGFQSTFEIVYCHRISVSLDWDVLQLATATSLH